MIWKIAKKEFLLNLMTFKFAVGAVACVLLTAVFMPILAADYRQRLETYNKQIADNEAELRKVKVYRNITPTIYRLPAVLSAFSGGLEKQLVGAAKIELDKVPELSLTQLPQFEGKILNSASRTKKVFTTTGSFSAQR